MEIPEPPPVTKPIEEIKVPYIGEWSSSRYTRKIITLMTRDDGSIASYKAGIILSIIQDGKTDLSKMGEHFEDWSESIAWRLTKIATDDEEITAILLGLKDLEI